MNAKPPPASPNASFIATTVLEANDEAGAIGGASDVFETVLMTAGRDYVKVRPLNTVSLFGPIWPYAVDMLWPWGRRDRRWNRQMQV